MYRLAGHKVGRANIYPRVRFLNTGRVTIANNSMINSYVIFDNSAPIMIGERVHIGPAALIATSTHVMGTPDQRASPEVRVEAVEIKHGAWIQARSTLLPGVTVGVGTVIGAGAVVTKPCEDNSFYAGIPARISHRVALPARGSSTEQSGLTPE